MSRSGWRPRIESALKLDVRQLARTNLLHDGACGSLAWNRNGIQLASIDYAVALHDHAGTLTLTYTTAERDSGERLRMTCIVPLSSISLHYGGRRWYLHCPLTGRRAQTLHKWKGIAHFCHRSAIRPQPTYASQRTGGSDRIIAQRWAIRRKLGDKYSDLFGEPCKPMRMHWRTFEKLAARDAELAQRENVYVMRMLRRLQRYA